MRCRGWQGKKVPKLYLSRGYGVKDGLGASEGAGLRRVGVEGESGVLWVYAVLASPLMHNLPMKLLILGGTRFVGRHLTEQALARGHEITLFHRGESNVDLFDGHVERILGDRKADLDRLARRQWDAVIDTCGYFPADVRASAEALKASAPFYAFISTISVYHDPPANADESAPLMPIGDPNATEITAETYGFLKVLCEQAVHEVYPGANLIVRPGLIVGPWDPTDRFTYWCDVFMGGGFVVAPANEDAQTQVIDVRDLAAFVLDHVERKTVDTFNVTAPQGGAKLRVVLEKIKVANDFVGETAWMSDEELESYGIRPWVDLPLYTGPEPTGMGQISSAKALAAGLKPRSIDETIADTIRWTERERPRGPMKAGLSYDRLIEVLRKHGKEQIERQPPDFA